MCWAGLGCSGLYWAALGCTGLYWAVQLVRMISLDDMHSENIWFSWSKSSNYQEKLRCHACDIRTHGGGGKWKIVQCSVRSETAIVLMKPARIFNYFQQIDFDHVLKAGENWYHGDKDRRLSGGHWWSNRRKSQVA